MILKTADDKSKRVTLLDDLQRSTYLDYTQKKWLREEVSRLKKGIQGERDSAHYIDSYFKGSDNHVILHDLRFVVDGDVAQIDHLMFNREGQIFLLETKNYAGSLVINDRGEFTAVYEDGRFGIPSPLEQSLRHERILAKLLERLEIVSRTQKQLEFHHVVMLHPKAIIERPPASAFNTDHVIKADQFPTWHQKFVKQMGMGAAFKNMFNRRNQETLKAWAEKLVRQHRPADLFVLPDNISPCQLAKQPSGFASATSAALVPKTLSPVIQPAEMPLAVAVLRKPEISKPIASAESQAKRLVCAQCQQKISFVEGKFCWNNVNRFGGLQYCREHQAQF